MCNRGAITIVRAALRAARAPLSAGLVLLACGVTEPANAVMIVVNDSGSTYALSLRVGPSVSVDTVQFNVTGSNVSPTPTPVLGSLPIDISVTPIRPANVASAARPVTLRVNSSVALSCVSGPCADTKIPFSKISWTSNGDGSGAIQHGQFSGAANQQRASFNANATYCSGLPIPIFDTCLLGSWFYQSRALYATRLTFSYANDTIYPAGTYTGAVTFTASME